MPIQDDDQPLFNIGVVAQLLQVHPETLRIWERNHLIEPKRKNRQRLYSNNDLKRLKFIHNLINKIGLNLAGVQQVIIMYSCWKGKKCPASHINKQGQAINRNKPCWRELGSFCLMVQDQADLCGTCKYFQSERKNEGTI